MYLKDQKHMAALVGEGSFTRMARRLNLSQPALSKWLLDPEQEIGMPLAVRSGNGFVFTEVEQIYLEGCRECLEAALEIRRELGALSQKSKQSTIPGGNPIRGAQASAKIYSEFHRKYPDIDLQFASNKNPVLKKTLSEGEVTMSLLGAMEISLPNPEYLKFMDEEPLVMPPKGHSLSYDYKTLSPNQPYPAMDPANLAGTPILTTASETSYGDIILTLYWNAGLESNIILRSNAIPLLYEMALNGVGAAMISDSYYNPEDGIFVYSLSPRIIVYQGIGLRSGHPLSGAEEYLIHLVMNNWGPPYYMYQYADYYLEQRKPGINAYEYNKT